MFNVIRLGSQYSVSHYRNQEVYIVRPHIRLPNSPVQKWGREYISLHHFSEEDVQQMCLNANEEQAFYIHGEFLIDRYGINYIKAHHPSNQLDSDYWITTIMGIDYVIDQNCILKVNENSKSQIFSMAFNSHTPKMFEATLILQKGDILTKGRYASEFCPYTNPFLNQWFHLD